MLPNYDKVSIAVIGRCIYIYIYIYISRFLLQILQVVLVFVHMAPSNHWWVYTLGALLGILVILNPTFTYDGNMGELFPTAMHEATHVRSSLPKKKVKPSDS